MKITKQLLKSKGACKGQAALFNKLFPGGVELTEALCIKHAHDFNFDWAAGHLLPLSARDVYKKAVAPAWEGYLKAVATAQAEYRKAIVTAWEEYDKAAVVAWAEYEKAVDTAVTPFSEARAIAFFKAASVDATQKL